MDFDVEIFGPLGGGNRILFVCPGLWFISHSFLRDLKKEFCSVTYSQCVSSSGRKRGVPNQLT